MEKVSPLKKGDVVRIHIKRGGRVRRERNHGRIGIIIGTRAEYVRHFQNPPVEYKLMRFDGGAQWFSAKELELVETDDV